MNKVKNFLYVYTGLRSLTNAIKHWLGMNMLEAKLIGHDIWILLMRK